MKKIKFYVIVSWIIFSRSFDAYCTNLHTPDLQKEANPLVSSMGLTWSPLLIILSLLMIYVIFAYYQFEFKSITLDPKEPGFSFKDYATYRYLGRKAHWSALLFQFPTSINRFNQVMGQLMAPCLAYAGVVSSIMWLLIFNSSYYRSIHQAALIYLLLISGCLFIVVRIFKKQFLCYRGV
ncbi:MAG: hypothetical protein RL207_1666 [Bacteroidota bacterium]